MLRSKPMRVATYSVLQPRAQLQQERVQNRNNARARCEHKAHFEDDRNPLRVAHELGS